MVSSTYSESPGGQTLRKVEFFVAGQNFLYWSTLDASWPSWRSCGMIMSDYEATRWPSEYLCGCWRSLGVLWASPSRSKQPWVTGDESILNLSNLSTIAKLRTEQYSSPSKHVMRSLKEAFSSTLFSKNCTLSLGFFYSWTYGTARRFFIELLTSTEA